MDKSDGGTYKNFAGQNGMCSVPVISGAVCYIWFSVSSRAFLRVLQHSYKTAETVQLMNYKIFVVSPPCSQIPPAV